MDAIGAIAGSSLEQTTWLRRNLEVKPSPKIMVDGNNLESDVEGSFIFIFIIMPKLPKKTTLLYLNTCKILQDCSSTSVSGKACASSKYMFLKYAVR